MPAKADVERIRHFVTDFLYSVHGWYAAQIDFDSIKTEKNKTVIRGSFRIRGGFYNFTIEVDEAGHLLSYEREKIAES